MGLNLTLPSMAGISFTMYLHQIDFDISGFDFLTHAGIGDGRAVAATTVSASDTCRVFGLGITLLGLDIGSTRLFS